MPKKNDSKPKSTPKKVTTKATKKTAAKVPVKKAVPKASAKKAAPKAPVKKAVPKASVKKAAPKAPVKKVISKPATVKTAVKKNEIKKPAVKKEVLNSKPKKATKETIAAVELKPQKHVSSGNKSKDALRKLLLNKREEIVRESKAEIKKYISGENRQLVETVMDEGDLSVVDLSEDISLKQLSTHREVLIKLDTALRKLEEDTYGICEECGDEISEQRLKILPFAIYCRDCQESKEVFEKLVKEER